VVEEKELVSALQSEHQKDAAFRSLLSQYKERLYWHIRKIVLNHDDTDDVLQNTFIKIFNNIGKFKSDSKLYTWMYRIATNEAITFINKKAKKNNITIESVKDQALSNLKK